MQDSPHQKQFIEGKVDEIKEDVVNLPSRSKTNFKVNSLVSPAGNKLNYEKLPGGHSTKVQNTESRIVDAFKNL